MYSEEKKFQLNYHFRRMRDLGENYTQEIERLVTWFQRDFPDTFCHLTVDVENIISVLRCFKLKLKI